ncbi:S41 family peptidase [Legionella sp. W05-934-2]|uniref:S41 family peptidase n=1 Tax=Legionella sp. W05-934-2 TaxID=1198649 RepID=UPI00346194F6
MIFKQRLLRYSSLSVLLLSVINPNICLAASPLKGDTPKEQYIQTIDYIARTAKDIYCYWDIKKEQHQVDWQTIIDNAKRQIDETTTFEQFQQILTQIAAGVHDGHVNYIYPGKWAFYAPISVKKLPEGYYIAKVERDKMGPYSVDVEPGDKVVAVNNKPIDDYIEELGQTISASTNHARQSYAASALPALNKFKEAPEDNLNLTVEKYLSKEVKTVSLPWVRYPNSSATNPELADVVQTKILPGNIGVLTITAMSFGEEPPPMIAYIKQQLAGLKNTKALIIDVRNNGGGWGEIGDSVVAHFITEKVKRYKAQLKNSYQAIYDRPELLERFDQTDPSVYEFSEWIDFDIQPLAKDKPLYGKPVYVLTNERCFSACDTFVDSFSSNHIGKVLGAQTGGGTGYPLWFELPWHFGNFRFSILRGYSNHDRYLEGVGTIPDIYTYQTPRDLYHQVDGEMIGAYNYVMNELSGTKDIHFAEKAGDLSANFALKQAEIVPYYLEEAYWQKVQQ